MMFVPLPRTLVPKTRAVGEYKMGMAPSHQGGMGGLPQKKWICRVSEKQSEALFRLFSQTILKEYRPFYLYFHMTYFTPVHSKTEYKLPNLLRSYVGTIGNHKLLTEISCTCVTILVKNKTVHGHLTTCEIS